MERQKEVAYHAYQSFKTGEVSPELAHKIGVELAEKMWGEHQEIFILLEKEENRPNII